MRYQNVVNRNSSFALYLDVDLDLTSLGHHQFSLGLSVCGGWKKASKESPLLDSVVAGSAAPVVWAARGINRDPLLREAADRSRRRRAYCGRVRKRELLGAFEVP